MTWIIIGVVVACLGLFVALRGQRYKKVFDPAHYVELARGLARIKAAASQNMQEEDAGAMGPSDPRVLQTSAGMAILYTISREGNQFVHHYSLSLPGTVTPSAVGTTFTLAIAELLGAKLEQLSVEVSEASVYHTVFALSDEEQAVFVSRPVPVLTLDEARALHEKCLERRPALSVGAMRVKDSRNGRI